mmetsp:Transcript_20849/g.40537  ORF Transcript_20849/g.40537 Transcript_20849/m.40537 type:complete len:328 (+) Transcript_20849:84-1067(+)
MELGLILAVIALIAALVIPTVLLLRTQQSAKEDAEKQKEAREAAARAAAAKRAAKAEAKAIAGNPKKKKGGLAKMQKAAAEAAAEEAVGNVAADAYDDDVEEDTGEPKTKKELQKAEKRAAKAEEREYINAQREAIKEREQKRDAARRAKDEEREAKERAIEEAEAKRKEEEEKRKQEEYDKWKDMFSVEEGADDGTAEEEDEGLLGRFVEHIKQRKVSTLESLAAEFGLKVQDVINRVQGLEQMGYITGVVDDRGKFIFISRDELEAVAKYINKKGRVRISTLAQESNKLIDLQPREVAVADDDIEDVDAAEAPNTEADTAQAVAA